VEYIGKCLSRQNGGWVCFNEFLAARLAASLGLPVPEFQVIQFQGPLAAPEQWFCSRRKPGGNPTPETFQRLVNGEQLPGIVAFDVWLCNTDRSRSNMWAENLVSGDERVWMIDHGHTLLTSGSLEALPRLDAQRIMRYGDLLEAVVNVNALGIALGTLAALPDEAVEESVHAAPAAWVPDPTLLSPIADFLLRRRIAVRRIIEANLHRFPGMQRE
jgi:hypothetical protein